MAHANRFTTVDVGGSTMSIEEAFLAELLTVTSQRGYWDMREVTRYYIALASDPQRVLRIDESTFKTLSRFGSIRTATNAARALLQSNQMTAGAALTSQHDVWSALRLGTIVQRIPKPQSPNQTPYPIVLTERRGSSAYGYNIDVPWSPRSHGFAFAKYRRSDVRIDGTHTFTVLRDGRDYVGYRLLHVPALEELANAG